MPDFTLSPGRANHAAERDAEAARVKRSKLVEEMTQLHERNVGVDLSPGDQKRWDNLHRGVVKLDAEIAAAKARQIDALERGIADGTYELEGPPEAAPSPVTSRRAFGTGPLDQVLNHGRGEALRAIAEAPGATHDAREAATRLVENEQGSTAAQYLRVAADPHYLRAYCSLLVDNERAHLSWSQAEREAFAAAGMLSRAMSIGTNNAGGYMVPFSLDPTFVLTNAGTINPLREIAKTALITSSKWHGITTAGITAEWKAEGAQVADGTPTLAQPSIEAHLADVFVPYSIEAEQDIEQLQAELLEAMVDAKQRHEATAFTIGTGSGQPNGVITAVKAVGGSVVQPDTAETFVVGDIYKVAAALPARHQANATWLTAPATEFTIRQFAAGAGPSHAFWADLGSGTPPMLLGKPYRTASDMDATFNPAATDDNYLVLLGDFSKYQIVDRLGLTTEVVPHLFGADHRPTGQRGLFMYWRVGGDVLDANAFRVLNVATTA